MRLKQIKSFLRNILSDPGEAEKNAINTAINSKDVGITAPGMSFTIYNAIGGKVVQFKTYNPNIDRGTSTLYIITDKDNLGEELGMIITKETLSR